MYKTCKGLTYAKYASGGDGSAVVYSGGKVKEKLTVKVDINPQYAEGQDHADGIRVAHCKKMTGIDTAFELADLPADIRKDWLGWETSTNDLLITDQEPGFIGVGFYIWNEDPTDNDDQWICYWIYKSKFTADSISVSTATDSIAYQHQSVSGSGVGVQLTSGGHLAFAITNDTPLATEAAAIAWLKTQAGITS
jgi:phi13 family phage major tail protein